MAKILQHKVPVLPETLLANSIYYVKGSGDSRVKLYLTDTSATAFPIGGDVVSVNGETGVVQLDLSFSNGLLSLTGSGGSINLDNRYLQAETDPTVPQFVKDITSGQITQWDSALQPGDNISELNNDVGYLTSFTEVDPVYEAEKARYVRNDLPNQELISGVKIIGDDTGATNQAYIEFFESNGTTRKGYIGDTQEGNADVYIGSDDGGVRIGFNGGSGEMLVSDTDLTYKTFDIYHTGNLDISLYALKTTTITGGTGLTGGGSLAANRVFNLDFDYLDGRYLSGYKQKDAVRVATTANITLSGLQTIDGVTIEAGDRIGVIAQTNAAQNGIYVAAAGAWTRSDDFNEAVVGEIEQGASFFVQEGDERGKTGWSLSTGGTIVVGTTDLLFIQYAGANTYQAGDGISINGNIINALIDSAIWNAGSLQGIDVASGNPLSNQLLRYNGSEWAAWTPNFLSSETDPIWTGDKPNYYTKTNLQTSGQASVHWDNITNVPSDLGIQNLSLGSLSGQIEISGGNSIRLTSLIHGPSVDDFNTYLPGQGFYVYVNSASTNWPTAAGYGVLLERLSGDTAGSFSIWKSSGNNQKLHFNVGTTGTNWKGWETFASEEHVAANYVSNNANSNLALVPYSSDISLVGGTSVGYFSGSSTNKPIEGTTAFVSWIGSRDGVVSGSYGFQMLGGVNESGSEDTFFYRRLFNGSWGTYYRVASREWVSSLSGLAQNLSLGANAGQIEISGGNNISLTSLWSDLVNEDLNSLLTGPGLFNYTNSTGSTGFPSVAGTGILKVRSGSNNTQGAFTLWKDNVDDGKLHLNVGTTGTSWNGWQKIATEEWSIANNVFSNPTTNAYLTVVNGGAGLDANLLPGANIFYVSSSGNPNIPTSGPFVSFRVTNGYGAQLSLQAGTTDGSIDNFNYRGTYTDGTGTWFRVASREWVNTTISTNLGNYLPLIGGTLTGTLYFNGSSGNNQIRFKDAGSQKWITGMSTSNNYIIHRVPDGTPINSFQINLDSGTAGFESTVSGANAVANNQFVTLGQSNSLYLQLTGGTLTGHLKLNSGTNGSSINGTNLLSDGYQSGGVNSIFNLGVYRGSGSVVIGQGIKVAKDTTDFVSSHTNNSSRTYIRIGNGSTQTGGLYIGIAPQQATAVDSPITGLNEYEVWHTGNLSLANSYVSRGTIPSDTDLNNITDLGSHSISSAITGLTNTPSAYTTGVAIVQGFNSLGYGKQEFNWVGNNRLFYRLRNSSPTGYGDWFEYWTSNKFTQTDVDNWNIAFTNSHTHSNKAVLDKLGEDGDGDLTYDGDAVMHWATLGW